MGMQERMHVQQLRHARELALRAASYISSDRADPDLVLANMTIIEAFLFGGDTGDENDFAARRTAVSRHLENLRQLSAELPGDRYLDNPGAFVTAAWKYYDRIMPGSAAARDEQEWFS
jgi:hypothetical protein